MPERFVEAHIRTLPLFARLAPDEIARIARVVRVLQLEQGAVVFAQGQPAEGVYYFVSGRGRLIRRTPHGQDQILGEVGPNQYLNEAALVRPGRETASLHVLQPAVILLIPRRELAQVAAAYPHIHEKLPVRLPLENPAAAAFTEPAAASAPAQAPSTATAQPEEAVPAHPASRRVFRAQRHNETVLVDTRRHWWSYVRRAWLPALIAVLVCIAATLMPAVELALAFVGLAFILPGGLMLYFYLEWANDHLIITDQRIVRIERTIHTLRTSITEVPLASIQQINTSLSAVDPFSRLFRYGNIELRTAGEAGNIVIQFVPRPEKLQRIIFTYRDRQKELQSREQRDLIRTELDVIIHGKGAPPQAMKDRQPLATERGGWLGQTRFINERGELVYRKHSIFWLRAVLWPGAVVLASIGLLVSALFVTALQDLGVIVPLFAFFLLLIGAVWFYWADWDWRNDLYIIGDETVQIIHRRPLWLQNENDQVLLSKVDNVTSDQGGVMQSLLDYGDVRLSLLGGDAGAAKVFRAVANPQGVQAEITRRQDALRRRSQEEESHRHRREIAEYLAAYHESLGSAPDPRSTSAADPSAAPPKTPARDRMRPPSVPRTRSD